MYINTGRFGTGDLLFKRLSTSYAQELQCCESSIFIHETRSRLDFSIVFSELLRERPAMPLSVAVLTAAFPEETATFAAKSRTLAAVRSFW
jgi:hypothetical protein